MWLSSSQQHLLKGSFFSECMISVRRYTFPESSAEKKKNFVGIFWSVPKDVSGFLASSTLSLAGIHMKQKENPCHHGVIPWFFESMDEFIISISSFQILLFICFMCKSSELSSVVKERTEKKISITSSWKQKSKSESRF